MEFTYVVERSEEFASRLRELVDLPLVDDSLRVAVAGAACSLAFEHWDAFRLLLRTGFLPSAAVVHRAQFESALRSIWLAHAASGTELEKLAQPLNLDSEMAAKNMAQTQSMMDDLSKTGPTQAHDALLRFKDNSWRALNSFAHAGIHPIQRHSQGYPEGLAVSLLANSNGLAALTGMHAVVLAGRQPLQQKVLDLGFRFPECMPPLL